MRLFLLPLNQGVFYPGTVRPLHVTEPRYVKLIKDAVRLKIPVAIALADNELAGFGTPLLLEERSDHSLFVLIQGKGKARIHTVLPVGEPYDIVEGERVIENLKVSVENQPKVLRMHQYLLVWVSRHVNDPSQRRQFMESLTTAEEVLGSCASFLIRDMDLQQQILEVDDINEKVQLIHQLLISRDFLSA